MGQPLDPRTREYRQYAKVFNFGDIADPFAWCRPTGLPLSLYARRMREARARRALHHGLTACVLAIAYAPPVAILLHSLLCRLSNL